MRILGLTVDVPTSSFLVMLEDEKIVWGSPEERLNREKQSMKFPKQALDACLDATNLEINDVDYLSVLSSLY